MYFRFYTAEEAIARLDEENFFDVTDIFLDPPRDGDKSAEDSDRKEGTDISHLDRRQLQAGATATLRARGLCDDSDDGSEPAESDPTVSEPEPGPSAQPVRVRWKREGSLWEWTK